MHLYRDMVSNYCREVRALGFKLPGAISLRLGLERHYIERVLGDQGQQLISINFYPPCPEPDLTYGFPAHTDLCALTILLQDHQVAGPQVLKDGKWGAVDPHPNWLVVNIGDQIHVKSQLSKQQLAIATPQISYTKKSVKVPKLVRYF